MDTTRDRIGRNNRNIVIYQAFGCYRDGLVGETIPSPPDLSSVASKASQLNQHHQSLKFYSASYHVSETTYCLQFVACDLLSCNCFVAHRFCLLMVYNLYSFVTCTETIFVHALNHQDGTKHRCSQKARCCVEDGMLDPTPSAYQEPI